MARRAKQPTQPVTVRVPTALRDDLAVLARQDKRAGESDYWRKVLSDHVDEARRAGKLPLGHQMPLGEPIDVAVHAGGAR